MICFINPPQTELREPTSYIPLGLAYLASHTPDCMVVNMAAGFTSLPPADVFGITCQGATLNSVKAVVGAIRSEYPHSKVLIGGSEPSVDPSGVFATCQPDYLITGEAEGYLGRFLQELPASGIYHAGILTPSEMAALAYPARHHFRYSHVVNLTGVHGSTKPSTTVMASRGCPYSCSFCCKGHEMYRKYRHRPAHDVVAELDMLYRRYEVRHVRFVDDCFTADRKFALELCDEMARMARKLTFICITRCNLFDEEIAEALAAAGCIQVDFGIESGSQRILDAMNKKATVEQNAAAIHCAHKYGMAVKAFIMVNYLTETASDREATLDFLRLTQPEFISVSEYVDFEHDKQYFYPDGKENYAAFKDKCYAIINHRLPDTWE